MVKVLAAGQQVRAEAEITFGGTGRLGGAWEVAEPTTTAGSPVFRTLELVSTSLGAGRREVLASPPLPTAATGAYQVRLRITAPEVDAPPPPLRYFVGGPGGETAGGQAGAPGTLEAHGPSDGGPADALKFSWQPVAGSIAFQLEFYEKDPAAAAEPAGGDQDACLVSVPSSIGRPPVTGVLVPGTRTEVTLGHAAAAKLAAGKSYLWRVVALDKDGKVLCDSPLKELVR